MSTARSTRPISRSTFLRSSLALTGGALAVTALGTPAEASTAAPTAAPAAKTAGPTTRLPRSWSDSVFAQPLPTELDGYVASFTTLYDSGPIRTLSARKIERADGFVNFLPYGKNSEGETFTPRASGAVRLDGGPVTVDFEGDGGTLITGEVQLVRTANPRARGLLLHVVGDSGWSIALPRRVPIVESLAQVDSPVQVTKDEATRMLADSVAMSFAQDGDNPARVDSVRLLDEGRHIVGRVSHPVRGTRVRHTWYGTAVGGDGGWAYLFGQLPES